ncbi:hypothetical protein AKJ57_04730 [candidate division MSBL1 archaeon SCGC-AAA259A05]|uniref:LarA-like N-terminal domain-containing protein n=1 Tax=candidate division MSBL1 archaeon SCGC-AAA259A05 TaxID=1698259 RepID=A0A133U6S1_9EURY|nr:hypothetical protein AKJ57_04730 [candidate division MSBL1 archaeon SCGC-AAA259A05]
MPFLLDYLNRIGVEDEDVSILVALGTHRYMEEEEILERFGVEVVERIDVVNHRWRNEDNLVDLGVTEDGIPIEVNKLAVEADYLIGVGSIVPHVQAGWGGGCKILQPGICSDKTIKETHLLAAEQEDYLGLAGKAENPVREKIEDIALEAGLDFIVNVVFDGEGKVVDVVCGHPVKAHLRGVERASEIFVRDIPEPADIVVAEAYPAEVDYWQGIKALAHAQRGVRRGGKSILVADFGEGISPVHTEVAECARRPSGGIWRMWEDGELEDGVGVAALILHAEIMKHSDVICVSSRMLEEEKDKLGFESADSLQEALNLARGDVSGEPSIGIIEKGGDVLPRVEK